MNFNEQDFLCHYGIKGMKWGIRRYEDRYGHLTPEGKARYGDEKGLKKHIKSEIKKSNANLHNALVARGMKEHAEKELEKSKARYLKTGKDKDLAKMVSAQKNLNLQNGKYNYYEQVVKDHYNKLVAEFGKEAVSDIEYETDKSKKLALKYTNTYGHTPYDYIESGANYSYIDLKMFKKDTNQYMKSKGYGKGREMDLATRKQVVDSLESYVQKTSDSVIYDPKTGKSVIEKKSEKQVPKHPKSFKSKKEQKAERAEKQRQHEESLKKSAPLLFKKYPQLYEDFGGPDKIDDWDMFELVVDEYRNGR